MAEDYRHTHANDAGVLQLVLKDIANIVKSMGKDITNYGLPELHESGISLMVFWEHCISTIYFVYNVGVSIIYVMYWKQQIALLFNLI